MFTTGGARICSYPMIQASILQVMLSGTHLKEKALHVAALGTAHFSASGDWINRFKRKDSIVYRTIR
jgi:hypothetical protein